MSHCVSSPKADMFGMSLWTATTQGQHGTCYQPTSLFHIIPPTSEPCLSPLAEEKFMYFHVPVLCSSKWHTNTTDSIHQYIAIINVCRVTRGESEWISSVNVECWDYKTWGHGEEHRPVCELLQKTRQRKIHFKTSLLKQSSLFGSR